MNSNLPPGVTESMIPGNRPEDKEYEEALDEAENDPPRVLMAVGLLKAIEDHFGAAGLIMDDKIGNEADKASLIQSDEELVTLRQDKADLLEIAILTRDSVGSMTIEEADKPLDNVRVLQLIHLAEKAKAAVTAAKP